MTDDNNFCIPGEMDAIPTLEELDNYYLTLESGKLFDLNWKLIGRRSPSPIPKEEPVKTDTVEKETVTKNVEFDFMEDNSLLSMRAKSTTPKGSAKKKTTNFAGVIESMKKHGRLVPQQPTQQPKDPAPST